MNENDAKEKTQQYLDIVIRTHGAFEWSEASQFWCLFYVFLFSLYYLLRRDDGVCATIPQLSKMMEVGKTRRKTKHAQTVLLLNLH